MKKVAPKRAAVFPPVASPADVSPSQEPQKLSSQELGPAVTQEFTDALGLEAAGRGGATAGRLGAAAAPSSVRASAPPSPGLSVEETKKLLFDLLGLIDQAVSVALKVEPEKPDTLQTPVTCMAPWVAAHAGDMTSETGMRLLIVRPRCCRLGIRVSRWIRVSTGQLL